MTWKISPNPEPTSDELNPFYLVKQVWGSPLQSAQGLKSSSLLLYFPPCGKFIWGGSSSTKVALKGGGGGTIQDDLKKDYP